MPRCKKERVTVYCSECGHTRMQHTAGGGEVCCGKDEEGDYCRCPGFKDEIICDTRD